MNYLVSIRGAITIDENIGDNILKNTKELLEEIMASNNLLNEDIISIIFSATKDITAVYPAVAAREVGITEASLLCVQEMNVDNSLKLCIRILMHVNKDCCQKDIKHIYLKEAKKLRPDLAL
jgi:chorismate mutase